MGRSAASPLDAAREWGGRTTALVVGLIAYESVSGLLIWLLPFSEHIQFTVLIHTAAGLLMLPPLGWYVGRHWWVRRGGNLSHYQLLGYAAVALLALCLVSGLVLTWRGWAGPDIGQGWRLTHLISGVAAATFVCIHLVAVIVRKTSRAEIEHGVPTARGRLGTRACVVCGGLLLAAGLWAGLYAPPSPYRSFGEDYNWRFGTARPFAPSNARLAANEDHREDARGAIREILEPSQRRAFTERMATLAGRPIGFVKKVEKATAELDLTDRQRRRVDEVVRKTGRRIRRHGAVKPAALTGSADCARCHKQIYKEWLPSAHRYAAMDELFQKVQTAMAEETSPSHTRYCAGCHDPTSLLGGAKNQNNVTLSTQGFREGASCVVCHSITRADVRGNADYTIRVPDAYVYEREDGPVARTTSDFLIRTYPRHHVHSYSRPLHKTAELCGACHKQYVGPRTNGGIGVVKGQNQYDAWKNSRWNEGEDPRKTLTCRECHMRLRPSEDPARGDPVDWNRSPDDKKHRSHRFLAANQYMPKHHDLKGADEHTKLIEKWLQGKIEIPEIADRWTDGPVVRMEMSVPPRVRPGERVRVRVRLTNNKAGHNFPTGPLDMIEAWVELKATARDGSVIFRSGTLGPDGAVKDPPAWYKAELFDRRGNPIDHHNLWDLVGASYKRTIFPGMTDTARVAFRCPVDLTGAAPAAKGRVSRREQRHFKVPEGTPLGPLVVTAVLRYRKANPEFLDTIYGVEANVRSPITELNRVRKTVEVVPHAQASAQ